jgi:hypothetical protein
MARGGVKLEGELVHTAKAALEEAVRAGIAPIPLKLRLMRHYWFLATGGSLAVDAPIIDVVSAELAAAQATDIAPYIHPKMASIQHTGDEDNPIAILMAPEDAKL